MTGRPRARSTRTPFAFIPTSSAPAEAPNTNNAAISGARPPASAGRIRDSGMQMPATRVTLALPNLSTSRPTTRVTRSSPAGMANSAMPSTPSLSRNRALIAGMRVIQTARTTPNKQKYAVTAARAARSPAAGTAGRQVRDLGPAVGDKSHHLLAGYRMRQNSGTDDRRLDRRVGPHGRDHGQEPLTPADRDRIIQGRHLSPSASPARPHRGSWALHGSRVACNGFRRGKSGAAGTGA